MSRTRHLHPEPDLSGLVLASFLVRVTVHRDASEEAGSVPPIPTLADVDGLIRYEFEQLTGCPVGVSSERTDT